MPKLCLTMIVKNEMGVIRRCFDSCYRYLDYWCIHDTGSTDGTPEFIENYLIYPSAFVKMATVYIERYIGVHAFPKLVKFIRARFNIQTKFTID